MKHAPAIHCLWMVVGEINWLIIGWENYLSSSPAAALLNYLALYLYLVFNALAKPPPWPCPAGVVVLCDIEARSARYCSIAYFDVCHKVWV